MNDSVQQERLSGTTIALCVGAVGMLAASLGVVLAFNGLGPLGLSWARWGYPLAKAGMFAGLLAVVLGLITLRSIRREPRFTGTRAAQWSVVLGILPLVLLGSMSLVPGLSLPHAGSSAVGTWGYPDEDGRHGVSEPWVRFSADGGMRLDTGENCNGFGGKWTEKPNGELRAEWLIETLDYCPHDEDPWMEGWDHMRVKGVWLVVYDESGREMGRLPRVAM